jgi:hypothetical protein
MHADAIRGKQTATSITGISSAGVRAKPAQTSALALNASGNQ